MKDLPVIEPKEIITTITNMKTGEVYKDDSEWKAKGIAESDIRKDVRVIMPSQSQSLMRLCCNAMQLQLKTVMQPQETLTYQQIQMVALPRPN